MSLLRTVTIATTLPALGGCALFSADQPGPGRVQEFTAAVERVHVEAELARERATSAVQALQGVATGAFGSDAVPVYEALMDAIGSSEGQAEVLASAVASMHAAAQPVFEHWATDLDGIADPGLRQRGTARLQAARERYRVIADAIDPAVLAHRHLNQSLRDHALFLGHDLNPAALADARPGIEVATQNGRALQAGIDVALTAARAYLDVTSLPVSQPAAPAGESAIDTEPEVRQPVRPDGQRVR